MRAARIHAYGEPDELRVDDVPAPRPGPRDVLIEVHAASVNPVDCKIRQGIQRGVIRYELPHTLGLDVSGVVTEVGNEVRGFKPGDEVYSSPTHARQGTYADFVAIDERAVALKPRNVTHAEAASLPLVGLTVWQALAMQGRVMAGQKVFISAGAGGVGSFAIQFAKHLGAHVATSCSGRNEALVRSLGADVVVDYTKTPVDSVLSDYDVALDNVGGEERDRALRVVRPGGRLVSVVAGMPENVKKHGPRLGALVTGIAILRFAAYAFATRQVWASQALKRPNGPLLARITELVEAGAIRPVVDRGFALEAIADAHRYSETGRARGKIVINVRGAALAQG